MKSSFAIVALCTLFAGCASTSTDESVQSATAQGEAAQVVKVNEVKEDDSIYCSREVKTGSHRKVRTCRTAAQRRAERDDAQSILRDTQTGGRKQSN